MSEHPDWVTILAWQGRMDNQRGLVIDRLERVGPGHYRSTEPVPVWGSWKTLMRVQDGYTMTAVPIWAPADDAIPGHPGMPPALFLNSTRPFVHEITILQRERDQNVLAWQFTGPRGSILVLMLHVDASSPAALTWGAGQDQQVRRECSNATGGAGIEESIALARKGGVRPVEA